MLCEALRLHRLVAGKFADDKLDPAGEHLSSAGAARVWEGWFLSSCGFGPLARPPALRLSFDICFTAAKYDELWSLKDYDDIVEIRPGHRSPHSAP